MDVVDMMLRHMRSKLFRYEREYLDLLALVDDIQREADKGKFEALRELNFPNRTLKITARRTYDGRGFIVHVWGVKPEEMDAIMNSPGGWIKNDKLPHSLQNGELSVFLYEYDDV